MSRTLPSTIVLFCLVFILVQPAAPAAAQDLSGASGEELRESGRHAFNAGDFPGAERFLRLAVKRFEALGGDHGVAESLGDLSSVLMSQERYPEAEQALTRAIRILKARSPSEQSHTPILLGNLGALYQLTGKTRLSEATFTEALRAAEKYLGGEAPYVAIVLSNLGAVYTQVGKDKLARKTILKALALSEKTLGKDNVELVPVLTNLAAMHEKKKDWRVAESLLVRAVALVENSLGRDHPDICIVLEHLAVVHFRQKKIQEAEQELRRALDIERGLNRAQGIRIASLSFNLARVLAAQGNYAEARPLYGEALVRQERSYGLMAPEVAATLEQYAKLLHNLKSDTLARQMEFRAKQIRAERESTVTIDEVK